MTDHLGSVAAVAQAGVMPAMRTPATRGAGVTDSAGALLDQQRYMPFGKVRPNVGTVTQTDFGYTAEVPKGWS